MKRSECGGGSSPKRSRSTTNPPRERGSTGGRHRDRPEDFEYGGREYHGEPVGADFPSPFGGSEHGSDCYPSEDERLGTSRGRGHREEDRRRDESRTSGGRADDEYRRERGEDYRERSERSFSSGRREEYRERDESSSSRRREERRDRGESSFSRGREDDHGRGESTYSRGGEEGSSRERGEKRRERGESSFSTGREDEHRDRDESSARGHDHSGRGQGDRGGLGRGGRGRGDRGGLGQGGRGRGGRGRGDWNSRRIERLERHDLVISRGAELSKRGTSGRKVSLLSNFFVMDRRPDWCIFNYHIDYNPQEERTSVKKQLLKPHVATLGAYIFDGSTLYVCTRINPEPMILTSVREPDNEKVELTIKYVGQLAPTDAMYLQFYNIIVRKCLSMMGLEGLGRHFYDRNEAIRLEAQHLELWPGYKTSMRHHEQNVLLGVEITHKVLRMDSCLSVIYALGAANQKKAVENELVGSIVMTHYNRKTYRVDDIEWANNPTSTFEMNGKDIKFADYFYSRYNCRVTDMRQPLLVSRPKKRDYHRGMTGPILLVPELCQMTGLTDAMRGNFQLMKVLTSHLHVGPDQRVDAVRQFMSRLKSTQLIRDDLAKWGLRFRDRMVEMEGRVLPKEDIIFGNTRETPDDKADWTKSFRNCQMLSSTNLVTWVGIVPARDSQVMEQLTKTMITVGRGLKFSVSPPQEVIRIPDIRAASYVNAINQAMATYQDNLQMIFAVLPNNKLDTYAAIKRRCYVDYGIPSQCFIAKNASKNLMSICTKIVAQINAKLGGEPWSVSVPLKNLMVIGFDVYHCGKRKGASVGAMVASTNSNLSKYFSTVSFHDHKEELSNNLCADVTKCLHAYKSVNDCLPDRIIMYRDGVGEGQLTFVYNTELPQIKGALATVYKASNRDIPKFSFLVVTKKINTRIFYPEIRNHGRPVNPEPGTIVDDVITLPERYDFFLISQAVRQGTVSPTSYNVLFDTQGLNADKIQRLTYKLTYMYFNWSGTVAVPAICQYAHKLAYLTGLALSSPSNDKLSHLLYYL